MKPITFYEILITKLIINNTILVQFSLSYTRDVINFGRRHELSS